MEIVGATIHDGLLYTTTSILYATPYYSHVILPKGDRPGFYIKNVTGYIDNGPLPEWLSKLEANMALSYADANTATEVLQDIIYQMVKAALYDYNVTVNENTYSKIVFIETVRSYVAQLITKI